jgi:hypothetical protein
MPAFAPSGLSNFGHGTAVTTSDSVVQNYSALYIGVTGDVTVVMLGDTVPVLFKAVPVGILPVAVSKVMATGTTATIIVGLA